MLHPKIILRIAVFASLAMATYSANAAEKYLPPAPVGDINAATANVTAPKPVVPVVPSAPVASEAKLPQYITEVGAPPPVKSIVPKAPKPEGKSARPPADSGTDSHKTE